MKKIPMRTCVVTKEKLPKMELVRIVNTEDGIIVDETGNNISNSLDFLGLQTNVYGYLYNADLFALPSLYEGIPMTLIEAMGTGLPIVASNVGGIPDMVVNGESATLVNVDEDQLAVAFSEMYNDERMRNQYGQRVLALSSKFSSETMAIKYIELYERSLIQ